MVASRKRFKLYEWPLCVLPYYRVKVTIKDTLNKYGSSYSHNFKVVVLAISSLSLATAVEAKAIVTVCSFYVQQ